MIEEIIKRAIVVGSGNIAKRHIRNIRDNYPEAVVTCVSSTGRAINFLEVGASDTEISLSSAARRPADFAVVASPANVHLVHAEYLLAHDIPVLIEKPLCLDVHQLNEFDCDKFRQIAGVAYNLRFMPSAQVVKKLLDSCAIGALTSVFAEVGQYLPDWRPNMNYKKSVSARKELGGGALLELSHEFDYLLWFFGPFHRVLGLNRNSGTFEIDVEDNVDALLEHENGFVVSVHLDFLQRQPSRSFKAVGQTGTLVWDLIKNQVELLHSDGSSEVVYVDHSYDRNQMYVDQMNAFIRFIRGYGSFPSTLSSGVDVMRLVQAIRTSSERLEWVYLEAMN